MNNTKKESPAADATRRENTIPVSDGGSQKSREITVPTEIIRIQQERIAKAAQDPGTDRLLADIYKGSLACVTDSLKSCANALHKERHHPLPFVVCQSDECVCLRTIIDKAIRVVAKKVEPEPEDEPEPEHEGDPDQLAHDPDLPPPSEVFK